MSRARTIRMALSLLPLSLLVGATAVSGQTTVEESRKMAGEIHAQAMALLSQSTFHLDDLPELVKLHGESAYLRDWQDPEAFHCWSTQGNLLYHVGEYEAAAAFLDAAAHVALSNGDPVTAAQAYLDAAWVMREVNRHEEARTLLRKAHDLRVSADMSASDRREIDRRIIVR
jgi:tetratricopeptide (TPR) repeat protein